jgi:hypothetical protein
MAEWAFADVTPLFVAVIVASLLYVALSFFGATRRGRRWRRRAGQAPIHGR